MFTNIFKSIFDDRSLLKRYNELDPFQKCMFFNSIGGLNDCIRNNNLVDVLRDSNLVQSALNKLGAITYSDNNGEVTISETDPKKLFEVADALESIKTNKLFESITSDAIDIDKIIANIRNAADSYATDGEIEESVQSIPENVDAHSRVCFDENSYGEVPEQEVLEPEPSYKYAKTLSVDEFKKLSDLVHEYIDGEQSICNTVDNCTRLIDLLAFVYKHN